MIITNVNVNLVNNTSSLEVIINNEGNPRKLETRIAILGPDNHKEIVDLANTLDWSNTQDGKTYHIENGLLVETPDSPGPSYNYDYSTFTWKDSRTIDEVWESIKVKRNELLKLSDWTQMPDVAIATKTEWAIYRQALRDITNQLDPYNIVWPMPPGG